MISIGYLLGGTILQRGVLGPALNLNFLAGPLDSRITFTRGTNATLVDSTGRVTYAPANLLLRSQEFDNVVWGKTNTAVTTNVSIAPDGTTSADALIPTNTLGTHRVGQTVTVSGLSTIATSVYAKANGYNKVALVDAQHSALGSALVDLRDGTAANITNTSGTTVVTGVGNGWYRISWTSANYPIAAVNYSVSITAAPDTAFTNSFSSTFTGDGVSGILVWGAQLEPKTYAQPASTYVATTTSPYYGHRFDFNPVTLAPRGLLIEEARTNSNTYSQELDNAAWTKSQVTVTPNSVIAPDGTLTADRIVCVANTSAHVINPTLITVTAAAWTTSIYLKQDGHRYALVGLRAFGGSGHGTAIVDLQTGTITQTTSVTGISAVTSSIQNAGNGWYRVSVTGTYAGAYGASGLEIGFVSGPTPTLDATGRESIALTTAATIYAWGAQLEVGGFATSYIPTVASTATRSGDSVSLTGSNFSAWYNQVEGTTVAEFSSFMPTVVAQTAYTISDGGFTNLTTVYANAAKIRHGVITNSSTQVAIINDPLYAPNVVYKSVFATKLNDTIAAVNGSISPPDTAVTLPVVNRLNIGSGAAGNSAYINGHIRRIDYYPVRLSDAQVQELSI